MKLKFLFLIVFISHLCFGQDLITDPKGNFLFGVPTTSVQPILSGKNVGLETPIKYLSKTDFYIGEKNNITLEKAKLIFFKFNLVSNSKSTLVFNDKTNYSPSGEVGFSWGFDRLVNPNKIPRLYFTYSASIFAEYQNFMFYDTINNMFSKHRTNRVSPGFKSNFSIFRKTDYSISLSFSYQHAINTDNLTSYSKRPNTFYFDENITTNGKSDGYLYPDKATEIYRASITVPLFLIDPIDNTKLPFFLMPYYYGIYMNNNEPNHNLGLVLSFLGEKFRNSKNFKFSQIFNIGYNFVSTGKEDAQYFFLSGTFSLLKFKKETQEYKMHESGDSFKFK